MHVHTDIFGAGHKRAFLSGWFETSTQTLLQKGRPFILRRKIGQVAHSTCANISGTCGRVSASKIQVGVPNHAQPVLRIVVDLD
jgi:hypothetical protein